MDSIALAVTIRRCAGWALGVVTSRAFATDGPGKPRSLLPLIDIANHSFSNHNCDIDKRQGGTMVLVSTKAIPAGSDLLLNYGALDNHTLLLDYGFMDPNNPFDHMILAFDIEQLQVGPSAILTYTLTIVPIHGSATPSCGAAPNNRHALGTAPHCMSMWVTLCSSR